MNTEPVAIARKYAACASISRGIATSSPTPGYRRPSAVDRNVRYVGALSRNDERIPLAQKKCAGSRTARTTNAMAPRSPTRSIASAGMIVVKIAAKRIATSRIGPHENSFCSRIRADVVSHEAAIIVARTASRTRFCTCCRTPRITTSPPDQMPDTITAPSTPPRNSRLCQPSMASGSRGPRCGSRTSASSRRQ